MPRHRRHTSGGEVPEHFLGLQLGHEDVGGRKVRDCTALHLLDGCARAGALACGLLEVERLAPQGQQMQQAERRARIMGRDPPARFKGGRERHPGGQAQERGHRHRRAGGRGGRKRAYHGVRGCAIAVRCRARHGSKKARQFGRSDCKAAVLFHEESVLSPKVAAVSELVRAGS